jgi:shikimate kinase
VNAALLVVVCGLSFAGKTTLGTALARVCNYKEVDVDLTKVYLRSGTSVDASRNFRKEERSHARHVAALNVRASC